MEADVRSLVVLLPRSVLQAIRSASVARLDAWIVRPLLLVGVWYLAAAYGAEARWIRVTILAATLVNVLAEFTLARSLRRLPLLPLFNVVIWAMLAARTGGGQSIFILGLIFEVGLTALRLRPLATLAVTACGVMACLYLIITDDTAMARAVATTGLVCIAITGVAFTWLDMRLRVSPESEEERHRAAFLAHGVKNSLHGVVGFTELLASDLAEDDPRRQWTLQIKAGLHDAQVRLGELLSPRVAEPRLGVAVEAQPSACSVIEHAVSACTGLLQQARVQVEVAVPDQFPLAVDARRFEQVLINLLLNAAQAMRSTGGLITVASSATGIIVHDTGPGVPSRFRERIFEPSFTTRPEGHGLGLAESRSLAREFGGDLVLVDSNDSGATFEIVLPGKLAPSRAWG